MTIAVSREIKAVGGRRPGTRSRAHGGAGGRRPGTRSRAHGGAGVRRPGTRSRARAAGGQAPAIRSTPRKSRTCPAWQLAGDVSKGVPPPLALQLAGDDAALAEDADGAGDMWLVPISTEAGDGHDTYLRTACSTSRPPSQKCAKRSVLQILLNPILNSFSTEDLSHAWPF